MSNLEIERVSPQPSAGPARMPIDRRRGGLGAKVVGGAAVLLSVVATGCAAVVDTGMEASQVVNPAVPGPMAVAFDSFTPFPLGRDYWVWDYGAARFAVEADANMQIEIHNAAPVAIGDGTDHCPQPTHFRLRDDAGVLVLEGSADGDLIGRDADRFMVLEKPGSCDIAIVPNGTAFGDAVHATDDVTVDDGSMDDADEAVSIVGLRATGVYELYFWVEAADDDVAASGVMPLPQMGLSLSCHQQVCTPLRELCAHGDAGNHDDSGGLGEDGARLAELLAAQRTHAPTWKLTGQKAIWGQALFFDAFEYEGAPMANLELATTLQTMLAATEMSRSLGSYADRADARFDIFPLPDPADNWGMPTATTHWRLYANGDVMKHDNGLSNEWQKFQDGLDHGQQWQEAIKAWGRQGPASAWRSDYTWYLREQDPATKQFLRAIWVMHYLNAEGPHRVVVLSQCGDGEIQHGVAGCGRALQLGRPEGVCDGNAVSTLPIGRSLEAYRLPVAATQADEDADAGVPMGHPENGYVPE